MAGEAPVYQSDMRVPAGPSPGLQPVTATMPDYSSIGAGVEKLGKAVSTYEEKLKTAQQETQDANVKSSFLTGLSALRNEHAESQDYQNAPQQFADGVEKLKSDLLGTVNDPKRRAELGLYMNVHGLPAAKEVNTKALSLEADANVAGLNERSAGYVRSIALAGSPIERDGLKKTWNDDIDAQANAGWISKVDAVQRKFTGDMTLDDSAAMAMIHINPRQALVELQDPEKFKSLGPVKRETLIAEAQAATDRLSTATLQNIATRDPARAAATVGRVGGPVDGAAVFNRGILGIETNGDPSAESPKGASGLSQLMPDTARGQLRRAGMDDIAALDDTALKVWLKANPDKNVALGRNEFNDLLGRYDGRVAVAAAGYNAGPNKTDEWVKAATDKFGPYFTPDQFASVVTYKETRDYIGKLYTKLGAPMDGGGLSPVAQYHAATAVHAAIASQESDRVTAIKGIATIAREGDDPAGVFKAGLEVDPARYAAWKQTQQLAAQAGDTSARKALDEAEFQREMLPLRQAALRMSPVQLEGYIGSETARLADLPNVTPFEKNKLDVAREVFKSVKENVHDNVIGIAEQAGLVPAGQRVDIDPKADPGSQDFRRALSLRGTQANSAADLYQGKAVALKPQEAAALKERYANAGPDDKFRIIQALGSTLTGNAYGETLKTVVGNDNAAEMVGRIAAERPQLAREILNGTELLKSKEVQEKAALVRPAFASKFGGQIYPDPAQQKAVEQAAIALYVSRAGDPTKGALYDAADTAGVEKAIEDITGPIIKRNGVRVPVAPGIDQGRFVGALDNLTAADLTSMGGAQGRDGTPVTASDISRYAVFKPLAPGSPRYVVGMRDARSPDGFAPILTQSEIPAPLVFNMATLSKGRAPVAQAGQSSRATANFRAGQAERIRADLDAARNGGDAP